MASKKEHKKDARTKLYLNENTPLVAALRSINKLMEEIPNFAPKTKYITVRGLGPAIDRAVLVAVRLQHQGHTVSFHPGTVTVVNESQAEQDPHSGSYLHSRKVNSMEIRVYLKP